MELSPELVLEAQADYVLVSVLDPAEESAIPSAIEAVRGSFPQLHLVDQSLWISGVGPLGGMAVLDDIERVLSGQYRPG